MSYVDYRHQYIKPKEVRLSLSKADMKTKAILKEAYNIAATFRFEELSSLSFTVPFKREKNGKMVTNKHTEMLRERFLIKFKYMNIEEYFIINEVTNELTESGEENKNVTASLLPYELKSEVIRLFKQDGLNARQVLMGGTPQRDEEGNIIADDIGGILKNTNWTVGIIDASFEISTRFFEWDEITALDALFQVAETYNAIVTFDTKNRKINLVKKESIGKDQRFTIGYGKYAKSMSLTSNADDVVTRMIATGREGITFSSINPTGLSYIDDFSFYLEPFKRDKNTKKTLQSSHYMSDSLCHALLDYQELVASKDGILKNLFDSLTSKQKEIDDKSYELSNLEIEYTKIDDNLDIAKSLEADTTNLELELAAMQKKLDDKKAEIVALETTQQSTRKHISDLQIELSSDKNFTDAQIKELKNYIHVRTFSDDLCITPEDVLRRANEELDKVKYPQLTVNTDIVNLFKIVEEHKNWDRLNLGDTIRIRYDKVDINIKARVTEMTFDFENESIGLVISNVTKGKDITDKLFESMKQSSSTTTSVNINKSKWSKIEETRNELQKFMNSEFDATSKRIIAGVNESVVIDRKGIRITNPNFPDDVIVIQSGVIALSRDRGNTWQTAIKPDGIISERLIGKILLGNKLEIDASDKDGNKTFTVDANGVWLNGMALYITGEDDENLIERWNQAVTQGKMYNGVKIDIVEGFSVLRSDEKVKTVMNATDGMSISHYDDSTQSWIKKFYVDTDGNIQGKDITIDRLIVRNGNNVVIDGVNGIIDFDQFVEKRGKVGTTNIDLEDVTRNLGITDENIIGTISAPKLNLGQNLRGTVVKNVNGDTTFEIDTSGNFKPYNIKDSSLSGNTRVSDSLDLTQADILWDIKSRGINVSVPQGATSVNITGLSNSNTNYSVYVTPSWMTLFAVPVKLASGFTIEFGTPAPANATIDWFSIK
ncbi:phage tail protein [Priestia flexa]|uniref:phage tail protein n=1 Tax=Priestia flexa TaxID=86664 RepID=UPI000473021C|nr:phage tail protein [Priestia flexa]